MSDDESERVRNNDENDPPHGPYSQGKDDPRPEWMHWVAPGSVSRILSKIRRAIRNGTGLTFSPQEVRDLIELGVMEQLLKAEIQQMREESRTVTRQRLMPKGAGGNDYALAESSMARAAANMVIAGAKRKRPLPNIDGETGRPTRKARK